MFQLGHEPDVQGREDENETEGLMEQTEGTQEHGIALRMYCFELGYWSLCEFRFFVCRIYVWIVEWMKLANYNIDGQTVVFNEWFISIFEFLLLDN